MALFKWVLHLVALVLAVPTIAVTPKPEGLFPVRTAIVRGVEPNRPSATTAWTRRQVRGRFAPSRVSL